MTVLPSVVFIQIPNPSPSCLSFFLDHEKEGAGGGERAGGGSKELWRNFWNAQHTG